MLLTDFLLFFSTSLGYNCNQIEYAKWQLNWRFLFQIIENDIFYHFKGMQEKKYKTENFKTTTNKDKVHN